MDHKQAIKDQIVVVLYSLVFFLVLIAAAVTLDLLSQWVKAVGVADYTYKMIAWSAHGMLTVDMILFFISLLVTSWEFVRGLRK